MSLIPRYGVRRRFQCICSSSTPIQGHLNRRYRLQHFEVRKVLKSPTDNHSIGDTCTAMEEHIYTKMVIVNIPQKLIIIRRTATVTCNGRWRDLTPRAPTIPSDLKLSCSLNKIFPSQKTKILTTFPDQRHARGLGKASARNLQHTTSYDLDLQPCMSKHATRRATVMHDSSNSSQIFLPKLNLATQTRYNLLNDTALHPTRNNGSHKMCGENDFCDTKLHQVLNSLKSTLLKSLKNALSRKPTAVLGFSSHPKPIFQ